MSRETNSLLLRYGINNFWSTYLNIPRIAYLNLQFNSFFCLLLRNYFLSSLKIQYFTNFIVIYVFFFKQERYSFIYKFLKLKKISISSIFCRKLYGFNLNEKKNFNYINTFSSMLLSLTIKYFLIYIFYFLLKKKSNLFNISNYSKKLTYLKKNVSKATFFWEWKLKIINYILKFKWLGLFCSFLIYTYTNKIFKVHILSILDKPFIFNRSAFTFKYLHNSTIKQKLYLVFLSFIYLKASLLNLYVSMIIKKTINKKHIKNLIIFFSGVKIIFEKKIVPICGLKFKIAGRLGGKLRKASFGYTLGYMKLMTLKTYIDYSCDFIYTQYGSFSLKLWLSDHNEHGLLTK